jgi:hypothetical protein
MELAQNIDPAIISSSKSFFSTKSEAIFGERVVQYVMTRLTVEQAEQLVDTSMLPPGARNTLLEREQGLRPFREEFTAYTFLRIYLQFLIRTYVNAWAEPVGHTTAIFDKVDHYAEAISQNPDCDKILDNLLLAAPAKVYRFFADSDSKTFDWSPLE